MKKLTIQEQFDRLINGQSPTTKVVGKTAIGEALVAAGVEGYTFSTPNFAKKAKKKQRSAIKTTRKSGYKGIKKSKVATPVAFLKDLALKAVTNRLTGLIAKTGETISSVLSKAQKEVEIMIAFSELKGASRLRQAWVDFIRVVSL